MSYAIGPLDVVQAGQRVEITFGYSALFPEFFFDADEVSRVVSNAGYNPIVVDVDALVPGFRKLQVTLEAPQDVVAGDVGHTLASKISSHFALVFDVGAEAFQIVTEPISGVPVTTAVSLASVAIIALLGLALWKRWV